MSSPTSPSAALPIAYVMLRILIVVNWLSGAAIVTAGIAGLVAGALSMAAGEFVSVSSQRDAEQADVPDHDVLGSAFGRRS